MCVCGGGRGGHPIRRGTRSGGWGGPGWEGGGRGGGGIL